MPEKMIDLPSGEKSGDSGASTVVSGTRTSIFFVTTFCTISERSFSVRTKYARRSPVGDHDIHGTEFQRPPGVARYSKPMLWSNPLVRLRMIEPSFAEIRTMSYSRSRPLPVMPAIRSPDGDGSIDSTFENLPFRGSGARSRP